MKIVFKNLGWICLGIFLQFKFNMVYGIVFLENLNFHDRTYIVKMNMEPTDESLRVLHLETVVHHSLGKDYFANVYIPKNYQVLNKDPYQGAEDLPGYLAYKMNMKRKYRDVLSSEEFILSPEQPEISPLPIVVHFENMNQRLHTDKTYILSTKEKQAHLEGPEFMEVKYPQKYGM